MKEYYIEYKTKKCQTVAEWLEELMWIAHLCRSKNLSDCISETPKDGQAVSETAKDGQVVSENATDGQAISDQRISQTAFQKLLKMARQFQKPLKIARRLQVQEPLRLHFRER